VQSQCGNLGLPITDDSWVSRDEHAPYAIKWAPAGVTLEVTWRGMEDVLAANLTRNIGISNYNAALIMDMCRYARVMPAIHQFEVHPMYQRPELIELGRRLGIITTMYSILGSGKDGPLQSKEIAEIAAKHSVKPAAVCIAWGLGQGCAVLAKSTNVDRIRANFEAEGICLDESDLKTIRGLDINLRTCSMVEYWGFPSHC
jgi:diketogulonate reductase-like aldo/keto reductase